jgi:prepilin-type N-terminal cleavage/methylation domain-containing protein
MHLGSFVRARASSARPPQEGFTLIELMIAMTISLLMLVSLVSIFANVSRSNSEMAKTNSLIENGRFAMQLLEQNLVHAGYWGGYLPQFDDLGATGVPGDVPAAVSNPCLPYANWDSGYRSGLLGIAVQSSETLPAGAGCLTPLAARPGTDVLVVRHAGTCVPGVGNCDADVPNQLYLQSTFCAAEKNAGSAQFATGNTIQLSAGASAVNGIYDGLTIRTVTGTGAGQNRAVTAYNGGTKVATVSVPWDVVPDSSTTYSFDYMLGTNAYPLHQKDCVGTGTPATLPITAGTLADKRKLVSSLYYISNVAHPDRAGEVVPTLMRSQLDLLAHQAPVALIDGIEAFRVELGIDNISVSGEAVDYSTAILWTDSATETSPRNRGDGVPDEFIRCTDAAPCTAEQLANVVVVKLYVLARSRDTTPGYTDTKSYCLGEPNPDGSCPAASTIATANDQYKRHAFSTSVRLINISGRRETAP